MTITPSRRFLAAGLTVAAVIASTVTAAAATTDPATGSDPGEVQQGPARPVQVGILTPLPGDTVGNAGSQWFINLAVRYPGAGDEALEAAGYAPQITGPAGHNEIDPFPGSFGPGQDELLPGLVVLTSTTTGFEGPGTNLANLFNLTGVGDRSDNSTEIIDSWIVGGPLFGLDTQSVAAVAVVDDLDGNGIYDDAPDVVPDADEDGDVDSADLEALGLASNIDTVSFHITG